MKVWLHGPREGQTFKAGKIQFIDGVAEVVKLTKYLELYYNVKDYPPEDFVQEKDVSINNVHIDINVQDAEEFKDSKELENVVKTIKENLNKEVKQTSEDWKSMPFFTMKAYVKEKTGKSPKNKQSAIALMKEAGFE